MGNNKSSQVVDAEKSSTVTIIHVNSNTIRSNRKHDRQDPPLSVRRTRSSKAEYAYEVNIIGDDGSVVARIVYQPETPLSCGAQVWIETDLNVETKKEVSEK